MSDQQTSYLPGDSTPRTGGGAQSFRASLGRELSYLLTISTQASAGNKISPAGLAHSTGVCMIEDWIMARGKGGKVVEGGGGAMPRFVDIKLTAEDRRAFLAWYLKPPDLVRALQEFTDNGYRVGVSWSGTHQSYTVSLTCRDDSSPNNGACMTSFAGELARAIALAVYKHYVVASGVWSSVAGGESEEFG